MRSPEKALKKLEHELSKVVLRAWANRYLEGASGLDDLSAVIRLLEHSGGGGASASGCEVLSRASKCAAYCAELIDDFAPRIPTGTISDLERKSRFG